MATKIGQLAQELSKLNPWWRDATWAARDPDLVESRAHGITYRPDVLDDLVPGGLYLLRGPRRVGKTVAVKQKIEQMLGAGALPTSIVRVAADGWAASGLRTLVQNTALPPVSAGIHRTWFIDEISAVTGAWEQQIKWLRDNDAEFRAATVVLTGSNATRLTEAAGALAGRRGPATGLDRTLLPAGFATFARLVSREPLPPSPQIPVSEIRSAAARAAYQQLVAWLDPLVGLWELYLTYGGFPRAMAAAALGAPIPTDFVEDLFNVVSADAFKTSRLAAHTEMALLERLWGSMASPVNLTSIGEDVGASHDVVARHIGYLFDSFLVWYCPQRAPNAWLPRPRAQDKVYAVDPLVARLAHLRNPARPDIDPTVLTEMQIGAALRRRIVVTSPIALADPVLFHVRTQTRKEIDFVSDYLAGTAVEAKYVESGRWQGEAATVDASEWDGVLVTRNVLDVAGPDAWAVPAGILAYAIDV